MKMFLKAVIAIIFSLLLSVLSNFTISDIEATIAATILFMAMVAAEGVEIKIINA